MEPKKVARQFYLDWARVIVILTVFIYHSTRFFNLGEWHIKNAVTYWSVEIGERVLATWMMPLAFVISGMSVFYALGKVSVGGFIKDKVLRLFVPLVVGIFTHSALQVYLERISHGEFNGSFLEFYPHYFDGAYGLGGNFGWMGIHLWYVEMLFAFSLIFLPLFWLLKRGWGQRFLAGFANLLAVPGVAFLFLAVPIILVLELVDENSFFGMDAFGGWSIMAHACFFIIGFVLASSERMQQSIQRLRWVWLVGAIVLTLTQVEYAISHTTSLKQTPLLAALWILTLLGWARQHLNYSTPRLQYANEAVLPFYILHQPVLIVIGYFIVQWSIPDGLKWLIISATSFPIIIIVYEFVVRRFNLMRCLFGMKALPKAVTVPTRQALPIG